ncbi:MAG: nitrilase [Chromatiaceae bacterium]|nr:nitrilase [Chromatiaceae bacterium]MCP5314375.1 nitrilase [Chromatiaceae bacterium]
MPDLYYAAACQTDFPCPTTREEIGERTRRMCELAVQTIVGYEPFFDVRLLVFPEFAHAAPVYDNVAQLHDRLAVPIPNEHTEEYRKLCQRFGCYIQSGTFLETDTKYPGLVFNTTALIGPEGVLAKYRKVNTWIPWEIHTSPHDIAGYREEPFPVVDTELGRLGVAICYDWLFPETIRQIAFNGAEVIIRVSAYMDPWGSTEPMDWWTLINRTRALENTTYVVAANQGARLENYPPFSWPGSSMITDYDGRILAQADAGPGEKVVVAPIDIARLRAERDRRIGHDMQSHLRSSIHPYLGGEYLSPAGSDQPLSRSTIEARIHAARRRSRR